MENLQDVRDLQESTRKTIENCQAKMALSNDADQIERLRVFMCKCMKAYNELDLLINKQLNA